MSAPEPIEQPWQALEFAAKVARTLKEMGDGNTGWGSYYVSSAEISFDGDPTGMTVVANEFDDYSVRIQPEPPVTT